MSTKNPKLMTPTPTRIATEAAEKHLRENFHEDVRLYLVSVRNTAPSWEAHEKAVNALLLGFARPLILSAAAKMVQQSGAVEALELTEKLSPDMKSTREAAVAAMTALDRLRSITGRAQPSPGDPTDA